MSITQNVTRWKCQVAKALGESSSANVVVANGQVTVSISWGDQKWDATDPDTSTTFALQTEI
ncbi:pre-pilin leader sequence [Xanthomonas campestris pv. raphani 756C]|nr:pre-pilin leader sequence [Xanthomonas campestris pv. raphani 756C]